MLVDGCLESKIISLDSELSTRGLTRKLCNTNQTHVSFRRIVPLDVIGRRFASLQSRFANPRRASRDGRLSLGGSPRQRSAAHSQLVWEEDGQLSDERLGGGHSPLGGGTNMLARILQKYPRLLQGIFQHFQYGSLHSVHVLNPRLRLLP